MPNLLTVEGEGVFGFAPQSLPAVYVLPGAQISVSFKVLANSWEHYFGREFYQTLDVVFAGV